MGKGTFITTLAANNPDINYVGIEKYSSVLLRAVEKQDELQLPNLRFIRMDAEAICEVFGDGEVDRIYLNFQIHGQKTDMRREDLPQDSSWQDMTLY